jgi:PAS domain S-box-containing protein
MTEKETRLDKAQATDSTKTAQTGSGKAVRKQAEVIIREKAAPMTESFEALQQAYAKLEQSVAERTEELARANEELREANEYLENMFNHANAPIIVWNREFRITRFNHAFEALTGRCADGVIGASIEILFPPALAERSMDLIRKTLGGERWESVEIKIQHLDGAIRTVLWNSATILSVDGKTPAAAIAQGQDITIRKQAEEALLAEKVFSDRLLDSQRDTVFVFEPATGKPIRWNKRFAEVSGYSDEEIAVMKAPNNFYNEDDLHKAREIMVVLLSERHSTVEMSLVTKEGTHVPFEYSATAITAPDGRSLILSIGRDITDRKQAEEVLKKRESDLEAKSQTLEELNTALKVLLTQREKDKEELEEKVHANVMQLAMPYIEKLKKSHLKDKEADFVNILELNLINILSPFLNKLSLKYKNLTPREIQIAHLVKEGKTSKEIAELLNMSSGTVAFHRENIRSKLDLKNKKENLRSYLMVLS